MFPTSKEIWDHSSRLEIIFLSSYLFSNFVLPFSIQLACRKILFIMKNTHVCTHPLFWKELFCGKFYGTKLIRICQVNTIFKICLREFVFVWTLLKSRCLLKMTGYNIFLSRCSLTIAVVVHLRLFQHDCSLPSLPILWSKCKTA